MSETSPNKSYGLSHSTLQQMVSTAIKTINQSESDLADTIAKETETAFNNGIIEGASRGIGTSVKQIEAVFNAKKNELRKKMKEVTGDLEDFAKSVNFESLNMSKSNKSETDPDKLLAERKRFMEKFQQLQKQYSIIPQQSGDIEQAKQLIKLVKQMEAITSQTMPIDNALRRSGVKVDKMVQFERPSSQEVLEREAEEIKDNCGKIIRLYGDAEKQIKKKQEDIEKTLKNPDRVAKSTLDEQNKQFKEQRKATNNSLKDLKEEEKQAKATQKSIDGLNASRMEYDRYIKTESGVAIDKLYDVMDKGGEESRKERKEYVGHAATLIAKGDIDDKDLLDYHDVLTKTDSELRKFSENIAVYYKELQSGASEAKSEIIQVAETLEKAEAKNAPTKNTETKNTPIVKVGKEHKTVSEKLDIASNIENNSVAIAEIEAKAKADIDKIIAGSNAYSEKVLAKSEADLAKIQAETAKIEAKAKAELDKIAAKSAEDTNKSGLKITEMREKANESIRAFSEKQNIKSEVSAERELQNQAKTAEKKMGAINELISEVSRKLNGVGDVGKIDGFEELLNDAKEKIELFNEELRQGNINTNEYKKNTSAVIGNILSNKYNLNNVSGSNVGNVVGKTSSREEFASEDDIKRLIKAQNTIKEIKELTHKPSSNKWIAEIVTADGKLQKVEYSLEDIEGGAYQVREAIVSAKDATSAWSNMSKSLEEKWKQLGMYLLSFASFRGAIDMVKQGTDKIRELDDAYTEMRKVSDEPLISLEAFKSESFDIAEEVASTGKEVRESTADWMRLGESIEDAKESAKESIILFNVSEFGSIGEATESLIAMSQAYKELSKEDIVDKLNYTGNKFSISTSDLAKSLQDSASALKVSGNDINEAIALTVAGNAIVQDPISVGAGIRTISLRITGTEEAKEELKSLGEDVDDFVVATKSKLDEQVKAFTAVKSNGFKGFSLLDDNGNYKSTYEILQGIASIFEEIKELDKTTGDNRANGLLELLAGKNRSNIAASILQAPELLKQVYAGVQDAQGSAQKELDIQMESINSHLKELESTVQEFWETSIAKGTINEFIDLANTIVDLTTKAGGLKTVMSAIILTTGSFKLIANKSKIQEFLKDTDSAIGKLKEFGKTLKDTEGLKAIYKSDGIGGVLTVAGINPVVAGITAATVAFIGLKAVYDKFNVTMEEQRQKVAESKAELEQYSDDIKSIKNQLEEIDTKIGDLNKKDKLSLIDDEELDKLENAKDALKKLKEEKEYYEGIEREKQARETQKLFTKSEKVPFSTYNKESEYDVVERGNLILRTQSSLDSYNNALEHSKTLEGKEREKFDKTVKRFKEQFLTAWDEIREYRTGLYDNEGKLILEESRELAEQIDMFEAIKIKILSSGTEHKTQIIEQALDHSEIDNLSEKLKSLSKEGKLTTDSLVKNFMPLVNVLGQSGISADELIQYIDTLPESVEEVQKAIDEMLSTMSEFTFKDADGKLTELGEIRDSVKETASAYDVLSDAIETYNETGHITLDQLNNILENYPQYLSALMDENGNIKLDEEALRNLSAARYEDYKYKILSSMLDNIKALQNEAQAAEFLANRNIFLAGSYREMTAAAFEAELANWQLEATKNNIAKGTQDNILNYAKNTAKLLSNVSISAPKVKSSSSGSAAKDKIKEAFDYEKDYLDYLRKAEVITDTEYYDRLNELNKKYYQNSAKHAKEYRDIALEVFQGLKKAQIEMLEAQKDDYDKVLKAVSDRIDEQISLFEKQKEALEDKYGDQIKAINDQIDALEEQKKKLKEINDEKQRQINIEQKEYALMRAQNQRTKKVFNGTQFVYETDDEAIKNAQNDLEKANLDKTIAEIEKAQERLETTKKALEKALADEINALDKEIKKLKEYKDEWGKVSSEYEKQQNRLIAAQILGADWEAKILSGRMDTLTKFKDQYLAIQAQIEAANKAVATVQPNTPTSSSGSSGGSSGSSGSAATSTPSLPTTADATKYYVVDALGYQLSPPYTDYSKAQAEIRWFPAGAKVTKGAKLHKSGYYYMTDKNLGTLSDKAYKTKEEGEKVEPKPKGYTHLQRFAAGVMRKTKGELGITQEVGPEMIMTDKGELLTPLMPGDSVFNPYETKNLFDWSKMPVMDVMKNVLGSRTDYPMREQGDVNINVNLTLPNVTNNSGVENLIAHLKRLPLDAKQMIHNKDFYRG